MIRPATILVVDDDAAFRASTERFLRSVGYDVEAFESAIPLLDREPGDMPTCVLLDLRMPGMSGLEAQEALMQHGFPHPIVFMSGYADVATSVLAMKRGAADFVEKPFDEHELLEILERSLAVDLRGRTSRTSHQHALSRLGRLTTRERQVCEHLMKGMLNKQIASDLGIAESTVKVHRSRMMEKLGVDSLVALIRLLDEAGGVHPAAANPPPNGFGGTVMGKR
jgi:FixJ family two-component response regulator